MEIKHLADQFGSALEEFGTPQGTVCCLHDELIPENDANPLEPEFRSIYRIDRHAAKNSDQEDKVEIIEIVDLGLKKESKILEILQKKDQRFVVEHQGEEKFSSAKNVEFLVKHEDSNVWSITTCDCRQTLDVYGRFTKYTVKDRCLTDCAKYKVSVKNSEDADAEKHLEDIFSYDPARYDISDEESESENYYSFCTLL
eukprot:GHVP01009475.1.p1 GENE.GHVP01009475.1~~GHVP01009475.1.p1  ORF type:complete len:199 (+),score=36.50 GHVP01009475.1:88-684(+)